MAEVRSHLHRLWPRFTIESMLSRATQRDRERVLDLCRQSPTRPTQIAAWIHEGGLETRDTSGVLFVDRRGGLAFVSQLGVVMPHLSSATSIEALARWLVPIGARVVVGPSEPAEALWRMLEQGGGVRTRVKRDQIGYGVGRTGFVDKVGHQVSLRAARVADLDEVVSASAAMAVEESKDDPARRNPRLFRRRILERIQKGRDFLLFENGKLVFKANVAALSPQGGHIEGVYTAPSARGRGLGRAGTAWITRWILQRASTATLLVNEDNTSARNLYEALGYRETYDSRTFLAA